MHILTFNKGQLARLAEATANNIGKPFKIPYTDETTEDSGFMLVKDEGIYLMNAFDVGAAKNNIVVYADGYEPDNEDCWALTHEVSADDFADFVPINRAYLQSLIRRESYLEVGMTEDTFQIRLRPITRN